MVQRMLDLYGGGGNPFQEEPIAPNPERAKGNEYYIKKMRITARRKSETDRSFVRERSREKDYYVSMMSYGRRLVENGISAVETDLQPFQKLYFKETDIQSESVSSCEVQRDSGDHEEETEESMADSTEGGSSSDSEFADDESEESGGLGEQIKDSTTVSEQAVEDPMVAAGSGGTSLAAHDQGFSKETKPNIKVEPGESGPAVPANGGIAQYWEERKFNIKVEPDQVGFAVPADGGIGECQPEIKPSIKLEPGVFTASAAADGGGLGQTGYTLERKPNIKQEHELIPENNLYDPNKLDDFKRVIIKDEIDLGEGYLKEERGLCSPGGNWRAFSPGLVVKNEATDMEYETENTSNDRTIIKEEIDLGVDEITAGHGLNLTGGNSIAASPGLICKEEILYNSVGNKDGAEIPMTEEPQNNQVAETTLLKGSKQETFSEAIQTAPSASPTTDAAADDDEDGTEFPITEDALNNKVAEPTRFKSIKEATFSEVMQTTPSAPSTTAAAVGSKPGTELPMTEDPLNKQVGDLTPVKRRKQETFSEAIQTAPSAAPTAAAAVGDEDGTEVPVTEDALINKVTAPAQLKNIEEKPFSELIQTAPSAAAPAVATVNANNNNNNNNNSWIPLHEIPVVSRHNDGNEMIGTLLVSSGPGGGRYWNKLCDSEGRELCLRHFLQYKKRKWLAVEAPDDAGNSHSSAKEARHGLGPIHFSEMTGTYGIANRGHLSQSATGQASHISAEPVPGTKRKEEEPGTANGSHPSCHNCDTLLPETEETQPGNQKNENKAKTLSQN